MNKYIVLHYDHKENYIVEPTITLAETARDASLQISAAIDHTRFKVFSISPFKNITDEYSDGSTVLD